MRIFISLTFLISCFFGNAQDSLQSPAGNGKLYGIFPLVETNVVYTDTVVLTGSVKKESLYDLAKGYFDKKEEAKYYFESEDKDAGELIYQGELKRGVMSKKSDIHFTITLQISDSVCRIKLFEVVLSSPEANYLTGLGYTTSSAGNGKTRTEIKETATPLENITVGKGEYSVGYCEKIDDRLKNIVDGLGKELRQRDGNTQ